MSQWMVVLVGLGALVTSAGAGWPLTSAVLGWAARAQDAGAEEPRADDSPDSADTADTADGEADDAVAADMGADAGGADLVLPPRAVLQGGTWIGILERLAVTGCLLAGYPAGIAYVIAVKGLGRYPELREHPGLSERFVIGTLASLVWAAVVGAAARGVIA